MKLKSTIIFTVFAGLFLIGCTEDKPKDTNPEVQEPTTQTKIKDGLDKTAEVITKSVESAASKAEELAKDVQQSAKPTIEKAVQKVNDIKNDLKSDVEIDAKALYSKCASCHGQNAQNAALGKSKVIKGWDKEKVYQSLKGYQDGTYGGSMKALMKSQVSSYSDDELKALSSYISNL